MGYNPLRRYRGTRIVDVTLLVVFTLTLAVLVVWAMR